MKKNLKYNLTWLAIMVVGYILIDVLELVGVIDQFAETTLVLIGINIILATGLNLIIGFSGQFSLGHAGFMAIGAYTSALITQAIPNGGGMVLGLIAGMALSALVALIVGIPTLRLNGDYLAIATMGVAEIIRIIMNNLKITNGPAGLYNIPQLANWSVVYLFVCLTTILIVNFIHSRDGRAVMSVREDEIAAESMGVNITKWKVIAFVLGAATAAIGGALHASYIQTIAPNDFGIMESINILIIVVMGGIGSITGTYVAAIVLGLLDMVLQNFGTLRMVLYSLALILIMVFKPSGLLGTWEFSVRRIFTKLKAKGDA
ncbi:branched-chain amino acid ABC transporter permease [Loigolactobacillus backii]|uniref:branched-chain amino acid ABC transporter permease n=1 Tax=Loigolactobacillus backii TaxID=375175 RepID=UPI0007F0E834|nr:branched-chain amino acid ABC transporter permease [Loigolactobacillus backii]ANK60993.1 branched-chain amino acid ABC transporter permease [Loigolactobacillus backii]ANK65952.1 branched-chain amino acid ABC transporter permease [Loigolactobacillus backii]ANK68416.1 branched-chain amino acid ABC transporter permease [Loigolactobacillus backii]MDA5388497.1 branched-chain amino acid ABC transporter permease [Loigolactobacillus backii]MDA5390971.1 branched-chain amino acid ABC transporter perm